ncbi:MAG TPA: ATP-dependent Clp protease proteolytic subunit [Phycisphaerae bacterium]|jgi:ATP-dependent Clp protease protease subunit
MPLYDSHGKLVLPIHPAQTPGASYQIQAIDQLQSMTDLAGATPRNSIGPAGYPFSPQRIAGEYQRYREMTVDQMLLENRVIFLVGEINHISSSNVIMRLLYLQSIRKDQDIMLYVNSPGGGVDDTLAMYDTMKFLTCDVQTFCIGQAMSGGAVILAAGTKGKRYALPHAKVMIHQPFGGIWGQTEDIAIQAQEILKTKKTLSDLLSKLTGQTPERIAEDQERDKYFDAHEAKAYGLVDDVLEEADRGKKEALAKEQETKR